MAELGDKTQLAMVGLAGIYDAWPAWLGGTLALVFTAVSGGLGWTYVAGPFANALDSSRRRRVVPLLCRLGGVAVSSGAYRRKLNGYPDTDLAACWLCVVITGLL